MIGYDKVAFGSPTLGSFGVFQYSEAFWIVGGA